MKKISMVLVLMMCLGLLVGCNQKTDKKDNQPEVEMNSNSGEENKDTVYIEGTEIRQNGFLPNNIEELTDEEVAYYFYIVINALKELDLETLEKYAKEEESAGLFTDYTAMECLSFIKNDEIMHSLWENTIGKMICLPETGQVVYKDTQYMFYKWCNDMVKNGEELPEYLSNLSLEEIQKISEKYDEDIPYRSTYEPTISFKNAYFVENGKIYFQLTHIIMNVADTALSNIAPDEDGMFSSSEYSQLAFGGVILMPTDEITTDDKITLEDVALQGDLKAVVEYFDAQPENDLHTDDLYGKVYRTYLKDADNLAKAQKWMDENVEILSAGNSVYFYVPMLKNGIYSYENYPTEERELIEDIELVDCLWLGVGDESYNRSDFSEYYHMIEVMKTFGVFDN